MLEHLHVLMQQMQDQIGSLTQHVKALQERQTKDSHTSSLPPSSDRFTRKTKSLRKKSDKKSGGAEENYVLWVADLKDLLLEMKTATEQARVEGMHWVHPLAVADWEAAFLCLLDEGELVTPRDTAPPGKKG